MLLFYILTKSITSLLSAYHECLTSIQSDALLEQLFFEILDVIKLLQPYMKDMSLYKFYFL